MQMVYKCGTDPHRHPRPMTIRLLCAMLAVWVGGASAQATPLNLERIAFESGERAAQPSVTVDPGSGFVVTWQEHEGEGSALRYALVDANGEEQRRGRVAGGPGRFVNHADFPSLAVLDNGDWVTFWLQKSAASTYAYDIQTIRSRDQGRHWDAPVVIHRDATATEHGFVSMVAAGEDRVRLIWLDGRKMASTTDAHGHGHGGEGPMTLRGAILGRSGVPVDERELDSMTCSCCQTDMARGSRRTLAVYRDRSAGEVRDISAVSVDAAGVSPPRQVHEDGWVMQGCPVNGPALAARGDRFLAVWPTMADESMKVRIAMDTDGEFATPASLARGSAELGRVDVVAHGEGWFVSRVSERNGKPALILSRLSSAGTPGTEQVVAPSVLGYPRMAASGEVVLLVFAEPAEAGNTRIAAVRGTPISGSDRQVSP